MTEQTMRVGRKLSPVRRSGPLHGPDWAQASPQRIREALRCALSLPAGGWFVVDATRHIGKGPTRYQLAERFIVAWRDGDRIRMGFDECPHMGASLSAGRVCGGKLVCPWHGLALGERAHRSWRPLRVHDDGVLTWVRLDEACERASLTDAPILPARPARHVEATIRVEARCEPHDVIANRLDPWHGAHFHPQAFAHLEVTEATPQRLDVRVQYRLLGRVVIEVDASFHCPGPRTIVMTIVQGEGAGSTVETHATPMTRGRTAVIESTFATSERPGFQLVLRMARAVRPYLEHAARSLWQQDAAYAERLYALRRGEITMATTVDVPSDLDRPDAELEPMRHEDQSS